MDEQNYFVEKQSFRLSASDYLSRVQNMTKHVISVFFLGFIFTITLSLLHFHHILTSSSLFSHQQPACDPFAKRTKSGVDLSHDEDPSIHEDKGDSTFLHFVFVFFYVLLATFFLICSAFYMSCTCYFLSSVFCILYISYYESLGSLFDFESLPRKSFARA